MTTHTHTGNNLSFIVVLFDYFGPSWTFIIDMQVSWVLFMVNRAEVAIAAHERWYTVRSITQKSNLTNLREREFIATESSQWQWEELHQQLLKLYRVESEWDVFFMILWTYMHPIATYSSQRTLLSVQRHQPLQGFTTRWQAGVQC